LWYDAYGDLQHSNRELTERAEQLTARIAESLDDTDLKTEPLVRHGDPRSVIVEVAKEWGADLIVIGTHEYTGLKRLLLGSVTQSVVSHAPCSVEVVRQKSAIDAKAEMEAAAEMTTSEDRSKRETKDATGGSLRLEALVSGFRIAMLTTIGEDGHLHSYPIFARAAFFDSELWFFTHAHTYRVKDVASDRQINVSYADADRDVYVSISGKGCLVQDRPGLEKSWDAAYEEWFSRGLSDQDLALLRVSVEEVEYWDSSESLMVRLLPEPQNANHAKGW
jgi:general stress protein 26